MCEFVLVFEKVGLLAMLIVVLISASCMDEVLCVFAFVTACVVMLSLYCSMLC